VCVDWYCRVFVYRDSIELVFIATMHVENNCRGRPRAPPVQIVCVDWYCRVFVYRDSIELVFIATMHVENNCRGGQQGATCVASQEHHMCLPHACTASQHSAASREQAAHMHRPSAATAVHHFMHWAGPHLSRSTGSVPHKAVRSRGDIPTSVLTIPVPSAAVSPPPKSLLQVP
jgi:hypothetical protein